MELAEFHERVKDIVSLEEFRERVAEKIDMMSGLCDEETAALMVLKELGVSPVSEVKIGEISETGVVSFKGKVLEVGEVREFQRDDGTTGRVVNLLVGDETGRIRVALWDEMAEPVCQGEIEVGQSLKIQGYVKDGFNRLEVNVGSRGSLEPLEEDVPVREKVKIGGLKNGMEYLNLTVKLLDLGVVREFNRKDGTIGRVRNLLVGDETGRTRLVLWDEKTVLADGFKVGGSLEIRGAYARENTFTGQIELHLGARGEVRPSSEVVEYRERITPISDIGINEFCNVRGFVSGLGELREFQRQDGSTGKVANIYLSDHTGRIRAALWGAQAEILKELDIGSELEILDCYAKAGRNAEVELSIGSRSIINIIK